MTWQYQTAKLLDWESRWPELVASTNPFAIILMAHLKTKGTRKNPVDRLEWKLRITEYVYANHPGEPGQELLRLVDWLMQLPKEQAIIYREELKALDEEQRMRYIPSFVRSTWDEAIAKGRAEGEINLLARQLERRFGPLPNSVKKLLGQAEAETVEQWGLRLMDAHSIEDIFGSALNQKPQRARRAAAAT
jgi:hypothetical protein